MKIYHICEICDRVFNISSTGTTGEKTVEIYDICPECKGEMNWRDDELIFKPYKH
ncbi:hypothetical protein [Thermosyntropha sp.]|uniref:hypothetical protein n=1 Tax=Thermosyntropha sp. TaxID=2740820 RepID=UPI0025D6FCB5|nr:hypothetical protein [Thermosyntropha sp.]MBO8159779.1 hypothetical protein [Thermosyntropha sp.]